MNGIENEAWAHSHTFARCTDNPELRALLARTRMVEQQQTTVNWLNPADQDGPGNDRHLRAGGHRPDRLPGAQRARPVPARGAQLRPARGLRPPLPLQRAARLPERARTRPPSSRARPRSCPAGRPPSTATTRCSGCAGTTGRTGRCRSASCTCSRSCPLSSRPASSYKSHGFMYPYRRARELYAEIAEVEEEHVAQYESLPDPAESLLEHQVLRELMAAAPGAADPQRAAAADRAAPSGADGRRRARAAGARASPGGEPGRSGGPRRAGGRRPP